MSHRPLSLPVARWRQHAATASSIRSSLPSFSTGTVELRAHRSHIERARIGLGPAFEPLGHLARGRHGMWTTENLKAGQADDAALQLQLETNPDVQRAVLGLARHQTGQAVRQFPGSLQRLEISRRCGAVFHRQLNSLAQKPEPEHHAGADFATERSRFTAAATVAAARTTSASVVKRPTLNRSELPASVSREPHAGQHVRGFRAVGRASRARRNGDAAQGKPQALAVDSGESHVQHMSGAARGRTVLAHAGNRLERVPQPVAQRGESRRLELADPRARRPCPCRRSGAWPACPRASPAPARRRAAAAASSVFGRDVQRADTLRAAELVGRQRTEIDRRGGELAAPACRRSAPRRREMARRARGTARRSRSRPGSRPSRC